MNTPQHGRSANICQECKRLKIKCSRTVPCDQCVRRGVEEICPDGRLTTGRTGRYLLTSAEKLHEENKGLKLRIRDLEEALEKATQQISDERHPLLEPHLLKMARPHIQEDQEASGGPPRGSEDPLVNQFGTMQVSSGYNKWLGATALAEVHMDFHDVSDDFEPDLASKAKFALPMSLVYPPHVFAVMAQQNLPPKEEAWALVDTYFKYALLANFASHDLVSREDFNKRIFFAAYGEDTSGLNNYKLCSLYSVLTLGALMDLSRPIYAPVTREWMEIAQSSVFVCIGNWEQTVESIEAVSLMCCIFPSRPELELSKTYYQISWCLKTAQSSLLYGRPLTMSSRFIVEVIKFKLGLTSIMEEIAELFMGTGQNPNYSTVLALDRKLRGLRSDFLHDWEGMASQDTNTGAPQRFMLLVWYHSSLLTLHRTYFAFAATRCSSENSTGGKLAPSVTASFDAAKALMESAARFCRVLPGMLPRMGLVWPHLFTSMIVLYSFAIRMPFYYSAVEASRIADASITVVYEPSSDCVRAKEVLPYLLILQERAHSSLASFASKPRNSPDGDAAPVQSAGDIPGLSTGIAVRSGESPIRNARRAARWYSQHGRGARFQALRHAQSQMFGTQAQYFGHTSPHMLHPVKEVAQLDATGHYFDADVGPGSGDFAAVPLPVGPPDPMAMSYGQPIAFDNNLQWPANLSDSSYGSTPEDLTQQELQASWSDFLSTL
ncbi:hypothetical protein CPB86DRAFT_773596 [Serendipita vermifera]|nr:hypothetical protein CPB86DRAFT_773596 [Serendipita vermifera]